ncbi:MAG TPA: HNH endonuclease [Pilimelia sp.]|nr:HNH endonuclease [Pilimelia sp.]
MSDAWRQLGGRRRTLARLVYARDRGTPGYVCPKCRRPIDWTLPYKDPETEQVNRWSKSVDHAHETQDGGALTDLANLVTVHLGCNASKGAARRHERTREARQAHTVMIAVDPTTL